jgi:uncharacterized membrane protein YedE/YeeE
MGLRFFLVLVFLVLAAAAVFFLSDALVAGVLFAGALVAGVLSVGVEDWDWATAGGQKPSQRRKKVPAKTTTAKRRTQTLPTAESWHP